MSTEQDNRAALAQPSPIDANGALSRISRMAADAECQEMPCSASQRALADIGRVADAALSQPSPAPELERPSVTGWLIPISGMYQFFRTEAEALAERAEYLSSFEPEPIDLEPVPEAQMSVAQHDRIVGALRAERDGFHAEVKRLIGVCASLDSEKREMEHKRDAVIAQRAAALARVAELEQQEPVAYVLFRDDEVYYETDDNIVISNTPGDETDLYKWRPVFVGQVAQAGQVPDVKFRLPGTHCIGCDNEYRRGVREYREAVETCLRHAGWQITDDGYCALAAAPQPAEGE